MLFAKALAVLLTMSGSGSVKDWAALKEKIRKEFPSAPRISVAELAALTPKNRPMLIDARSRKEFSVSHLENALFAETLEDALRLLATASNNHQIVVYCSVGYRSAQMAEKIRNAGYTNVRNLEGSIFEWANLGFPVYKDGKVTQSVHPFDKAWGRFLNRKFWSEHK